MQIVLRFNSDIAAFRCSFDRDRTKRGSAPAYVIIGLRTVRRIARGSTSSSAKQMNSGCAEFEKNPDAIRPRDSMRIAIFSGGSTALKSTSIIFVLMVRARMRIE
jgi:hypothetical protein